jgi:ligand-binding sensor domain-containing protein
MIRQLVVLFLLVAMVATKGLSFEIDRFQRINTEQGLSQNSVNTMICDSKGFLWLGTNNGLNKYDGYTFKVYNDKPSENANFTNNRIVNIWEDKKHFIWFETYDGYYHYHNPTDESFQTLPRYSLNIEEKNSRITCFFQFSDDEIWLGSSNSGVYVLKFNPEQNTYDQQQFLSRGQYSVSNNNIRFILADAENNIWIGTANGLNLLKRDDFLQKEYNFQHFFSDQKFTEGAKSNNEVWFGTQNSGAVVYNVKTKSFITYNTQNSILENNTVNLVRTTKNGNVLLGGKSLYIVNPENSKWKLVAASFNPH